METLNTRTVGELKEVLYKPEEITLQDQEAAYWIVRNPGKNLTILPFYRLGGREFPKTYGHFHEPEGEETYQVLYGKAGLILQKMEGEKISQIQLKVVNLGETFVVPAGVGHALINLGESTLITLDDHDPQKMANVYDKVKAFHGMGYFIVGNDGGWEAIPNPNFSEVPPLQTL